MKKWIINWNATRIIRLILGIITTAYAIYEKEYLFLIFAGIFFFQAAMNISCCGTPTCAHPNTMHPEKEIDDNK